MRISVMSHNPISSSVTEILGGTESEGRNVSEQNVYRKRYYVQIINQEKVLFGIGPLLGLLLEMRHESGGAAPHQFSS